MKSVLYIEDNPANLRLVTLLLSRLPDIRVLSAQDPVTGLKLAEEEKPDLILLDITLPKMDGFEVLRRLREQYCNKNTPVFAISANAMSEDIKAGLSAGFSRYITKPINLVSFLTSVKTVVYEPATE